MEYKSETTGARIVINPCSLTEAFKLKSLIEKSLVFGGRSIEELLDEDLMTLLLTVDSSEEVMLCLFDCLKKSTYNDIAIKPELFDDVKCREDLYEIFYNCIKVNIYPFFKKVLSKLKTNAQLGRWTDFLNQTSKTNSDSSVAVSQGGGISVETPKE